MSDRPDLPELDRAELARYSRHVVMPEVGLEGQKRLKASSVLLVGAGGLGSPLGLYLAAAGVGRIGLVDFDRVDESNLHRQVLYGESDVGRPKLEAAVERLRDVNPHVRLEPHEVRLTSDNAMEMLAGHDVVIDGTDNFPTRYLVNDACVLLGKPNVYGSIFRFEGQASVFAPPAGPCYRCLFPEPPPPGAVPSCAEGGVLGILPGIIGTIQATEALKLLLGRGETLIGRLLLFDALGMSFRELKLRKDPGCALCGESPTIRELVDYEQLCGVAEPAAEEDGGLEIDPRTLKRRLESGDSLVLVDVRTPQEWDAGHLDAATHIPLQELPARLTELSPDAETVFICRVGGRSLRAAMFAQQQGFGRVLSLSGGLKAWAAEVDSSLLVI